MITVEHWAEIRRLHKVEKLSKRAIASRLGIHRDTVTRALAADTPPTYEREPRGSILDPYKPKIHALLTQDPNLSGVRIQEIIAGEGYPGKISILRGFLREIRPQYKLPPVYIRMDYHPAEYAQIDWGEMPDPVLWEGHLCKVHAFLMVMCFSRLLYLEFSLATKLEDFLRCHQNGLRSRVQDLWVDILCGIATAIVTVHTQKTHAIGKKNRKVGSQYKQPNTDKVSILGKYSFL